MISVKLEFEVSYGRLNFIREMIIWTNKTSYNYYPLSYSLQECLELICERLNWEYVRYEIFDSTSGHLYAMKPESKMMSTPNWWDRTDYTGANTAGTSGWSSNDILYTTDT